MKSRNWNKKREKKVVYHRLPGLQPQSLLDKKQMSSGMKKIKERKELFSLKSKFFCKIQNKYAPNMKKNFFFFNLLVR